MAELLVFMQDVQGADVYHTAKLPKRGDVIDVKEDGAVWGVQERENPLFQIVSYPGVPASDFAGLLSPEIPDANRAGEKVGDLTNTLQHRGFKFDIDAALAATKKGAVRPGVRTPVIAPIGKPDVSALKARRPAIDDPRVIGDSGRIIG